MRLGGGGGLGTRLEGSGHETRGGGGLGTRLEGYGHETRGGLGTRLEEVWARD